MFGSSVRELGTVSQCSVSGQCRVSRWNLCAASLLRLYGFSLWPLWELGGVHRAVHTFLGSQRLKSIDSLLSNLGSTI